jgi:hypothetical protein
VKKQIIRHTGSSKFLHQIIDSLAANLPRSRVIELPAGHAPQLVSMDKFLEELARFQANSSP